MSKIKFKKIWYKNWWVYLLVGIIILGFAINITKKTNATQKNNDKIMEKDSIDDKEMNDRYLSNNSWSLLHEAYSFAIEVDDYDGDVYEAGEYKFTIKNGIYKTYKKIRQEEDKIPVMYDIYVTHKNYSSVNELQKSNEIPITVGGIPAAENDYQGVDLTLEKGEYVFVVPFEQVGKETGTLEINKID